MDRHSPGQGLMPASFKVRAIPLDGDDDAIEEVLDPDFGEAAIGRVAPFDSGSASSVLSKLLTTNHGSIEASRQSSDPKQIKW